MELRIYCTACDYRWLQTPLEFFDPEETWKPTQVAYTPLPGTPCLECGTMQWRAMFTLPVKRETPENEEERTMKQVAIAPIRNIDGRGSCA